MEQCWCGHKKEEHLNFNRCGHTYLPPMSATRSTTVNIVSPLEDRVRELELKFERIVKVLERFQSSL
jgi:hypothetical protein